MPRFAHHPVALVLRFVRANDRKQIIALKKVGDSFVRVLEATAADAIVHKAVGRAAGGIGLIVKVVKRV